MTEEVVYADLQFHESSQQVTLPLNEKDTVDASSNCKAKCPPAITLIGLLILVLFGGLLAISILLLQAYENEDYFQNRSENMSRVLSLLQSNLCNENGNNTKDRCLLCPMGGLLNGEKCYYSPDKKLSWQDSQKFCIAWGGNLIIVKSKAEKDFLNRYKCFCPMCSLWIGLSCSLESKEQWTWIDNTTFNGREKIACKERKCIYVQQHSQAASAACSLEHNFICERLAFNFSVTR
ncbi:C-type lectin domain family 2 member B-like [Pyxicephalus adspersus]|uniref:C-type lectin domain family 2 member B-like n=1 Tax=Pyxicephalus adspersus TaxID=30357 RepID=UPI003B5A8F4C